MSDLQYVENPEQKDSSLMELYEMTLAAFKVEDAKEAKRLEEVP
jgi:hypothetical protein